MQENLDTTQPAGTNQWLPPGFRFHPTDEELITFYLARKVADSGLNNEYEAITEVDLNKHEPWELPGKAKMFGEREWYFFSLKDKKYPSGCRTNRATRAGYWKATGKDKEVFLKNSKNIHVAQQHIKCPVGMKKTLVFYEGRAPKGLKSNWVMHEYRLHNQCSCIDSSNMQCSSKPRGHKEDTWVLCRVFHKRKLHQKSIQQVPTSPVNSSKHLTCSHDEEKVSHANSLLLESSTNNQLVESSIVNCDWLPPLCSNENIEFRKLDMEVSSCNHLTHEDLRIVPEILMTTPTSNLYKKDPNIYSHQFSMSSEELDTTFKPTTCISLPRFPSELESLWLQTSSFLV